MHVLVLGANGLLGSNVIRAATTRNRDVSGTYHSAAPPFQVPLYALDICNRGRFEELLETVEPDFVVNCAAMTGVDACERHSDRAFAVNAVAPGDLAATCERAGIRFCHISTDYVFDGTTRTPYHESAETGPIQVYGESKLEGERTVRDALSDPLILRLSFVYGNHGATESLTGFPAWVRDQLRSGETVRLFTDQFVTPSRAGQVSGVLLRLLRTGATGTYHLACRSCVTPYEFGEQLRSRMGAPESLLESGSLIDTDRAAQRPTYTCLDVGHVEEILDTTQPTLAEDIDAIEALLT